MKFRLSPSALSDLDEISRSGIVDFGVRASEAYMLGLDEVIKRLAENPQHYQIREGHSLKFCGVRLVTYKAHTIVFRIDESGVVVIGRIAYGSSNWLRDLDHHL